MNNTIDYREMYLKKMNRLGNNPRSRMLKHKEKEFNQYFENALNREECTINGKPSELVFQDHSQSNNKDLSDDKYIVAPNNVEISVGSYIGWRSSELLVFTEEIKTIPTHQQLKAKIVNWNLKWIDRNKKIVNEGNGYGAYVQNQTLYTLGVSTSGDYLSVVNGKMMMYVQDNIDTRLLKVGSRVFIGRNVYKIMFADTVSRKGLINLLMEEDTITENDNRLLGVADYYDSVEEVKPDVPEVQLAEIIGEKRARLGSSHTYKISESYIVSEWIVESIEGNDAPFYVQERDDKSINLRFKDDYRYVSQVVNIIAKLSDGSVATLSVKTINKFA